MNKTGKSKNLPLSRLTWGRVSCLVLLAVLALGAVFTPSNAFSWGWGGSNNFWVTVYFVDQDDNYIWEGKFRIETVADSDCDYELTREYSPGTTVTYNRATTCNYIVHFPDIPGYETPDPETGTWRRRNSYTVYGEYVEIPDRTTFNMDISPWQAANGGAQWRIKKLSGTNCSYGDSGDISAGQYTFDCPVDTPCTCDYEVSLVDGSYYAAPTQITFNNGTNTITVNESGGVFLLEDVPSSLNTYDLSAVYYADAVRVTAALDPSTAIDAGAQWKVVREASGSCPIADSGWLDSGEEYVFNDITATCSYTIKFSDLTDWIPPTEVTYNFVPGPNVNDLGTFTYEAPTGAICDDFNDGSLDPHWRFVDNTNSGVAATVQETNGKIYMSGRGSNQFSSVDEYAALYLTKVEGDFEAVVEIVNKNSTSGYSKCGLMFRNDISDSYDSLGYACVGLTDSYGFFAYYDSTNNGILNNSYTKGSTVYPSWVKVVRTGDVFSSYYSTDGTNWVYMRDMTVNTANDTIDIGIYLTAYNSGSTKYVEFDNFCVTEAAEKVPFTGLIEPAGARANARWRLFNTDTGQWETDWLSHNETAMVLADNTYNVYWSNIDGYLEPSPNPTTSVFLASGSTGNSQTGYYASIVTTSTTTLTTEASTTTTTTTAATTTTTTTTIPGTLCLSLADVPMETQLQAAPAMIMFVLDDSGSMDWCFMTDESDGLFSSRYYNWYMSDNGYGTKYLSDETQWKAKYAGYNHMYYDPMSTYDPWPNYNNANINAPQSDPTKATPTLALGDTYVTVNLEYLVDDLDGSPDFTYTESNGASFGVSSSSQAIIDDHYLYSNAKGDYEVVWTPTNLPAGVYNVYVNWVTSSGRADDIVYTINHAGGATVTPSYDQSVNGGSWQPLVATDGTAEFTFSGDPSENVTLAYSVTTSTTNRICADAVKWVPSTGVTSVDVKNAHYYTYSPSENAYYLVNLSGDKEYYRFGNNDTNYVTEASIMRDYSPPDDVIGYTPQGVERTYEEELQNFANWFTYYRRRELAAKAAVSNVIDGMQGVQIGLYTINSSSHRMGVTSVNVASTDADGVTTYTDNSSSILTMLYDSQSSGGTPLRLGLKNVGAYYHEDETASTLGSGTPYAQSAEGGDCQQAFAIVMTDGYWNGSSPSVGNQDGGEGAPFADSYSDTLADVAMKYYKNDLSSNRSDQVPTSFTDKATYQHMVTYSISFGVTGTLNPDDFDLYNSNPSARVYPTWPNPTSAEKAKIDDMWHAAVNGRGEFLSAANPTELVDSLQALLQDVVSRIGSGASVSVNGEELSADTLTFQSSYSVDGWTGDLQAYTLDANTAAINMDTAVWSTQDWLDDANWNTDRIIATYTGTSSVPFRWTDISAYMQTLILDEDTLNFVRGDDSNEVHNGGSFRDRNHKMGDLVHSAPRFFNDTLFVGGNDGMLHAVNSNTGAEAWAYVPLHVFHNLYALSDVNYSHQFYVDLTPSVRSAGSTDLLVGGLGKGGKGYFCIDITNADSIATEAELADSVLWEYPRTNTPAADVADVGYSFSLGYIIRTTQGWSVIFGNGYSSPDQSAVLFILDAMTGELIRKIDTGTAGTCNGLSTPLPVDRDFNGVVDAAYAGDLKGNLWKFDLSSADPNAWGVAFSSGSASKPMISVSGPGGTEQPITTAPVAIAHCDSTLPGYLVMFGTGKYLGDTDFTNSDTQTLYCVWDFTDDTGLYYGDLNNATGAVSNSSAVLVEQTEDEWVSDGANEYRVMSENEITWATANADGEYVVTNCGWYFNLPISKERIITELTLSSGTLTVITTIPKDSQCSAGGESMLMQLDPCTGTNFDSPRADINGDGLINIDDMVEITKDDGSTEKVAPAGVKVNGRIYPPVYVTIPDYDEDGANIGDDTSDDDDGSTGDDEADDVGDGFGDTEFKDSDQNVKSEMANTQDKDIHQRLVSGDNTGILFWMEVE
ncbi:Tfp pilus assembly protein, tip-associated adhesin PilY1 [Desulfatibacillum alkenivorans DSM 16219]|jgi:Mg-chelatase subunit ChlD|uniref:Tfp pilus assembly protein, tip-associated adhesin PilY1 n=1 Tax=Desulfatibacillum alkenivorans DSM 16219 TaxID=1121393 RepID=A0A1M6KQ92_9BACT|nr:PilC/PilY family type IV pilus protein [Desulfatibacillum alkenivorans]SHJ61100.1 Tfp pilus assembly protein, tip-associated adhesin PilY1 [Desulfatibacillum alkenivorans DSM 16219]